MRGFGIIRTAIDEAGNKLFKKRILSKIPPELRDQLAAEGGDIEVDVDQKTYKIIGCSEDLVRKIVIAL